MGKQAVLDVPTGQSDDPNRSCSSFRRRGRTEPSSVPSCVPRANTSSSPAGEVVAADAAAAAAAASSSSGGDGGGNARFSASSSSSSSSSSPPLPPLPPPPASLGVSFDVLEAVRQVVTAERSLRCPCPPHGAAARQGHRNDRSTKISDDRIEALQRTASFLVASTNSILKAAAIQRMGGRAVDIRNYKVDHTLKRDCHRGMIEGGGGRRAVEEVKGRKGRRWRWTPSGRGS